MTDTWSELALKAGPKCVMNLDISDEELHAETARQWNVLTPMLIPLLTGDEVYALDYGCGAGRFTRLLAETTRCWTTGYDPCQELIAFALAAPRMFGASYSSQPLLRNCRYHIVFTAMVLGAPDIDIDATAAEIAGVLAPGGLLILLDHMPEESPKGRWWRYLPEDVYQRALATNGIALERIGKLWQLDNEVTVLAGRKPR